MSNPRARIALKDGTAPIVAGTHLRPSRRLIIEFLLAKSALGTVYSLQSFLAINNNNNNHESRHGVIL